jgi:hypothetical protein
VRDHVGDLEGVDEGHQRAQMNGAIHEADDERAQRNFAAELGHDKDGIDVAGVIRQDEERTANGAEAIEAVDLDAVTKPDEGATDIAKKKLGEHVSWVKMEFRQTNGQSLKLNVESTICDE